MSNDFLRGFQRVIDIGTVGISTLPSQEWINSVEKAIENFKSSVIDRASLRNISTDMLQGFTAETFHAETFNINAVINDSQSRAFVPDSNKFGSPDILLRNPKSKSLIAISLKYYSNEDKTLKALSETPYERYSKLKLRAESKGTVYKPLNKFSKENGRNISRKNINKSIYYGQNKIVPSEQLEKIQSSLDNKIKTAKMNGDVISLEKYKEVKKTVQDIISDGNGCESVPLTRENSQKLAEAARNGTIDDKLLKELGVDKSQLIGDKHIAKKALSAGINAAVLMLVLNVAPKIIGVLSTLIQNGEIDVETLRSDGIDAVTSTAKSYIEGALTSGVYLCCKLEKFGETLKNVDANVVGSVVVLTMSLILDSIKLALGDITKIEFVENATRNSLVLGLSLAGGAIATALFPELAFIASLLGSLIGSAVGVLIYKCLDRCFMALIVESGCTFFGLVEQNYELPENVLKQIGVEPFEYDKFEFDKFQFDSFEPDTVTIDKIEYERIGIKVLRRGVIEVGKIGYM